MTGILRKSFWSKQNILFIILSLICVMIAISPVYNHSGWPMNHEEWSFFDRIRIYSLHFRYLDFIPLWSTNDGMGMGTPLPLFYHKLFYYVAGIFYLIAGSMKVTVLITIAIFMLLGCLGLYKCCRVFDIDKVPSFLFANCIVFLNYTFTNWFVRGAMAEFSATMLVPYLLFWCLNILKIQQFSYAIVPILIAMYLSHSIIAYFGCFILFFALVIAIIYHPANFKVYLKRSMISIFSFFLILSIYFIPMCLLSNFYNISKIQNATYQPVYQFKPFKDYFFDKQYKWLDKWETYSVQLDFNIICLTIAAIVLILYFKKTKNHTFERHHDNNNQLLVFIIISEIFLLLMQCRFSNILYEIIPGANFIQFPWRLLSYIQVFNLLLLVALLRKNVFSNSNIFSFAVVTFILVLGNYPPLFNKTNYDWFSSKFIEEQRKEYRTFGIGEYMPDVANLPSESVKNVQSFFTDLSSKGIETMRGQCNISFNDTPKQESLSRRYMVHCKSAAIVAFPINFSGLEWIYSTTPGIKQKIYWYRTNLDPRLRIILPEGEYCLQIHLPQIGNLFHRRNVLEMEINPNQY